MDGKLGARAGWVALAPLLAGCLSSAPAELDETQALPSAVGETLQKLGRILEALIPLPDGLNAHGTVFLPEAALDQKVPVVMDLGPYYGNLGRETYAYNTTFPPNLLYNHFLQRGYAVALVSLRGTGQSEGCFKIGGAEEQADAAAIVEWLASQEWSNGNVAMTGVSYDGTTPWEAAVTGTPSLKAIVPVEGISDMYRYMFFEGVPAYRGGGIFFNTYYTADVDLVYTDPEGVPAWAAAQPSNVCAESANVILAPYHTYRDGVHGPFWDERDTTAMLDNVRAATFVVHGLQDWNVKPDNVQFLWDSLPEPKRMLLGQWEHNIPWRNTLNHDWDYAAYNATITQWFDAFLKKDAFAREAALAAPRVMVQDSSGAWWNFSSWPPEESAPTPLYLGPERTLSGSLPEGESEVRFRSQPSAAAAMPLDALALEARFTSPTLREPVILAGNPSVTLTVSVDQPGGYLAAWLYDLDPLGSVTPVAPGYLNLANRGSRDSYAEVPVNTPMDVAVKMYALAHVFQPGHRIVLSLQGHDPSLMPVSQFPLTTFTVHLSPEAPASLHTPLLRGAVPAIETP